MASSGKQNMKKVKGQHVSSRYKQAAEKVSRSSGSTMENTTIMKVSRESTSSQASGCSSQDSVGCSKFSTSQESKERTSTPASKGKTFRCALDASAIDNKGYLAVPLFKEGMGHPRSENVKKNLMRKNKLLDATTLGPVVVSHKDKKKNELSDRRNEGWGLDILYFEYLQAAFLEFETKKALKMRSQVALEQINKLFSLVMLHLEDLNALKKDVRLMSCMIRIYEHCEKQESIFKSFLEIIPLLEEKYKSLAEAVNATKHRLSVRNVVLPEPGSESEIIDSLEKTNDIMCDFLRKCENIKEIGSSADIMQKYADEGAQLLDVLKRGFDLLAKAKDLVLTEAMLELDSEKS